MRMLTLCLIVILVTTFTSLVFCESTPTVSMQGTGLVLNLPSNGKIFYQDPENNILLIDFKEVHKKLTKIQVVKKDEILLEDKVGDLAEDSIYEVDLNTFGKGAYTVTLITTNAEEIKEEFIIK